MNSARPIYVLNTCKVSGAIACLQGYSHLALGEVIHVVLLCHDLLFSFFLWNCDEDESVRSMHQKD